MRTIKITLPIITCLLLLTGAACKNNTNPDPQDQYGPGTYVFQIQSDSLDREYIVYVPELYEPENPTAIVLMLHGGGGTAKGVMNETGWDRMAEQAGFIAVFPEGSRPDPDSPAGFLNNPRTWNDGSGRQNVGAVQRNVDDIGFINALLDDMSDRFNVDEKRVFAAGFSNGAGMVFRIGRELSNRLTALACVASSDWQDEPVVEEPVSLIYMTGTADPLNPIEGGEIFIGGTSYGIKPPVWESVRKWVQMLGCPTDSLIIYDSDGVLGTAWKSCTQGSEVALYTIDGMGHWWPGYMPPDTYPTWLRNLFGEPSDVVSGTELIWNFFQQHQKN